jgi:hypothetical protein
MMIPAAMATLHQDLWVGSHPRRRGLRLGPFRGARVRAAVFPEPGASLDDPELREFLERLADRVEVVALDSSAEVAAAPAEVEGALGEIERSWGDDVPLVVMGLQGGAPLALAAAHLPCVRGVVLLDPPGIEALLTAADVPSRSAATEKPLLIAVTQDRAQSRLAELQAGLARWPHGCLVLFSAGARSAWRPPWPGVLAEWALAIVLP